MLDKYQGIRTNSTPIDSKTSGILDVFGCLFFEIENVGEGILQVDTNKQLEEGDTACFPESSGRVYARPIEVTWLSGTAATQKAILRRWYPVCIKEEELCLKLDNG